MFLKWKKEFNYHFIFLSIFLWEFMGIYFIKISHQRYLYPVIPILLIFFIYFLKNLYENNIKDKQLKYIFVILSILILIFAIYPNNNFFKKIFELIASIIFLSQIYLYSRLKKRIFIVFSLLSISIFTLFVTLVASAFNNQLYNSIIWGNHGETCKISELFQPKDIIYVNGTGIENNKWMYMIKFFRQDPSLEKEWHWVLVNNLPKKKLLKEFCCQNTFVGDEWNNISEFKKFIKNNNIEKIVMVKSTIPSVLFYNQELIDQLMVQNWLNLDDVKSLKNKEVYIFINNGNSIDEKR